MQPNTHSPTPPTSSETPRPRTRTSLLLVLAAALVLPLFVSADADAQSWFRRGDANGDGRVDFDDATYISEYLFVAVSPAPPCEAAADVNADGVISNSDALTILNWLNATGPAPSAPGPDHCGPDPTPLLSCATYACPFIRGDANGDGAVDGGDVTAVTNYVFNGGTLPCLDAADANDDGAVDNSDVLHLLGGNPITIPGPLTPGADYTGDTLDCQIYGNPPVFVRGDADGDTLITMNDSTVLLDYLFQGGSIECVAAGDANGDGIVLNDDSIYILNFLNLTGPAPPAPYPLVGLAATALPCEIPQGAFIRGDVNGDGRIDANDVSVIQLFLNGGATLPCEDAADANDDGVISLSDTLVILNTAAGGGGPLPPAPGPFICGPDPTADNLGCANYTCIPPADFIRGDCNTDGFIDIADPITALGILFPGPTSSGTTCRDACDTNDDGVLNIADPVNELNLIFLGGAPLPAPYPNCGFDATPLDGLECDEYLQAGCP